jgi:hypothetical protein
MFPMTITLNNPAQLNAVIAALNIAVEQPAPQAAVVKEAAAPAGKQKATAAKTESAATTAPTAEAADAPASTPSAGTPQSSPTTPAATASSAAAATEAVSYQETATAITKLSRVKGRDTAVALLAKFGAANLKEVKPEQFAAVLAAANEAAGA